MASGTSDRGSTAGPEGLPAPPGAQRDSEAVEVLRAWIVQGGLQVSLQRGFEDPHAWGVLLADVARHASRSYAREGVMEEEAALLAIRELFVDELDRPTDLGTTESQH